MLGGRYGYRKRVKDQGAGLGIRIQFLISSLVLVVSRASMQYLHILQGEPFPFASSFSKVILNLGELTGTLLPQKPLQ